MSRKNDNSTSYHIDEAIKKMDGFLDGIPHHKEIPSSSQKGKHLIFCDTLEKAENIKRSIEQKAIDISGNWKKPLRYKVNTISAMGTNTIGITPAYQKTKTTIKHAISFIENQKIATMTLGQQGKEDYAMSSAIEALKKYPEHMEIIQKRNSGNAYRVQYYDMATGRRNQINVNDVLIIVNPFDQTVVSSPISTRNHKSANLIEITSWRSWVWFRYYD